MSNAAKWVGSDEPFYNEHRHGNDKGLVEEIIQLFDETDVVIAHNADKYDVPTGNARAIFHGITPNSPFRTSDTLKVDKARFRFESNSLAYQSKY